MKNIMELEEQDCKLLALQPDAGEEFGLSVSFFQHAEVTLKQPVLNRRLIYQATISMHLIVLGQSSVHSLGND